MKVLLFDTTNAFLTPGGKTTHAVKLQQEISRIGVDIQFSRWWDMTQSDADIIHFLSPSTIHARQAKAKGIRTFFSMIFDFETSKTGFDRVKSLLKSRVLSNLPCGLSRKFGYWNALPYMDRIQFMHEFDRAAALRYFPRYIDREKTLIIPHAYDPTDMFISENLDIVEKHYPEKYLISLANISPRKQTVRLARYAKMAKVPIVFMGSRVETDPYFQAFQAEVDNKYVYYPGYVSKEWRDCIMRNASGYVLLSLGESGCIAVHEAAGYHLPLLLSNLPWAWGYDCSTDISFCDQQNEQMSVEQLAAFYAKSGRLNHTPFHVLTWSDIARIYVEEYSNLMK